MKLNCIIPRTILGYYDKVVDRKALTLYSFWVERYLFIRRFNMRYGIGLDIGIASVGSAVVMLDSKDEPCKIIKLSSRIFEAAENPSDGSPLAAPRRENRGTRRRLRRRSFRKLRIKELIKREFKVDDEYIDSIYAKSVLSDIYEIRCFSLDRILETNEFIRLLIHLSQRRGFKSNRKVDALDKKSESGALLSAVNENNRIMEEKGYRTIGEMLYKDEKFSSCKRNKSDSYAMTFSRQNFSDEIKAIFSAQRRFGNCYATEEFEEEYLKIYLSQRAFDDGPGGNSPYGGNLIENMMGRCTFEKEELRAVKASFSFEYFNLLTKVNAIKIVSGSSKRVLSTEEREKIISLAFKKNNISYASLRKAISLPDNEFFNISYGDKPAEESEKKTKFAFLSAYHIFKKAFSSAFDLWSIDKRNALAYALTVYKNDIKIIKYLTENNFEQAEIDIALTLPSFKKTGNLSIKALDKIIPYLEKGMLYSEACEAAGYNFKADDKAQQKFLPQNPATTPELSDITNPVVRRAVSQTIKVINSIIREMGESPVYINVELARELSKSKDERNKINKAYKENNALNQSIVDELRDKFNIINPTGMDIVKLKLWKDQDGVCPYSQRRISADRLFETGYVDVDHIVPYSISFDDSYNNKVLVFANENRQKGNRLPLQYLTGKRADDFIVHVENSRFKVRKRNNLLKTDITEDDLNKWKTRNLNDTKYISRFMLNFIKKYLAFAPNSSDRRDVVKSVNGGATAYIRKRWGISKVRENGDCHHAVDALVIACTTTGMIQQISKYHKYHETRFCKKDDVYIPVDLKTGEVLDLEKFPMPYGWFRQELEMRCSDNPTRLLNEMSLPNYGTDEQVDPIFVSRMPKHKVTGSAHKETIRKPYVEDGDNYTISKVSLTSLKLKNGEIENYFNPSSDVLLYNALKARLLQFGGDAKKAFEEPFYKPKSDGTQGPLVKKVKVFEKATLTVPVLEKTAVADNGSMVRVDVFYVENQGYYLVPIYVADTVKPKLPQKAITANKSYDKWKEMDDKDFVFSLYPNDLIKVTSKKEMKMSLVNNDSTLAKNISSKEFMFYYKKASISTASITVINHDNTYTIPSLGVKGLLSIEKYQVDVLGKITKVNREKRLGFK